MEMGQNCIVPPGVYTKTVSSPMQSVQERSKMITEYMPQSSATDTVALLLYGKSLQGHPSETSDSQPTYYSNTLLI